MSDEFPECVDIVVEPAIQNQTNEVQKEVERPKEQKIEVKVSEVVAHAKDKKKQATPVEIPERRQKLKGRIPAEMVTSKTFVLRSRIKDIPEMIKFMSEEASIRLRIQNKVKNGMVARTLAKSRLESETRTLRMEAERLALNSSMRGLKKSTENF